MADEPSTTLGLRATALFCATSIVAALIVGAMLVSGYRAGVLDNRVEWVFWAGAILGAVGIGCFGVASMPLLDSSKASGRISALTRVGIILFMIAPVLCVVAVFTDYWI